MPEKQDKLDKPEQDYSKYIFHLWTSKTQPLKYLSELLKDLLTDCNLECSSEGIKLLSINASRSVLIHMKLFKDSFEDYKCENPLILGINLDQFFKIIKNMENTDTLRLFVANDNVNMIGIERYNKEENITNTVFQSTIDVELSDREIPAPTFSSVIVISSVRFQKICREISQFSENIEIIVVNDELIFRGCNNNSSQEIKIKPSTSGIHFENNNTPDKIIQGIFKLKNLVLFSKSANLTNTLKIMIKNNYPIVISADISGLGYIRLCLAPHIEEE